MFGFPTAGMTEPKLCAEPLGTEGEMTPGPDNEVPYDDPEYWEGIDTGEPVLPNLAPVEADFPVDDFPKF